MRHLFQKSWRNLDLHRANFKKFLFSSIFFAFFSQLSERRSDYELEFSTNEETGTLLYTAGPASLTNEEKRDTGKAVNSTNETGLLYSALVNMLQLALVAGHLVIK
jgi:hypothetical protein